jgi:hypothetical protein
MATAVGKLWLPTHPASVRPTGAPDLFDHRPERNLGQPGIRLSTEEWDNRFIATAIELGCPPVMAEQCRYHPPARFQLAVVWCMVQDAAEGDPAALAAVERIRQGFRGSGHVGEILSALEQPANPAELQHEMGLD